MKAVDIVNIFPVLQNLMGDIAVMALGGYPSLVTQGILKEERNSKDIDVTLFSVQSTRIKEELVWNLKSNLITSNNTFNISLKNTSSSFSRGKKQAEELKKNIGLDKSYTIEITMTEKPDSKSWREKYFPKISDIFKYKYQSSSNFSSMLRQMRDKGTISINDELISKFIKYYSYKIEDENVFALLFEKWMISNNLQSINIDIFCMNLDKIKTNTINIDSVLFTRYYPILKAKYEYCLNPKTSDLDYNKHLLDIEKSYLSKRIKGINCPEDIEFIKQKRIEGAKSVDDLYKKILNIKYEDFVTHSIPYFQTYSNTGVRFINPFNESDDDIDSQVGGINIDTGQRFNMGIDATQ